MNATITRAKAAKKVSGTVKLVSAPVMGGRLGELVINGKGYLCQRTDAGFRLCCQVDGAGRPVSYDLPADLSGCDCPDHTFRPHREGGCKHMAALAALVKRGLVS